MRKPPELVLEFEHTAELGESKQYRCVRRWTAGRRSQELILEVHAGDDALGNSRWERATVPDRNQAHFLLAFFEAACAAGARASSSE